jgi:hypothetical protein
MKLYIDLATRRFVRGQGGTSTALSRLTFKRRDVIALDIDFLQRGEVVPTPAGTTIIAALKSKFSDGEFLAVADSAGTLDLYTQPVEDLFVGNTASVSALIEVKWSAPGEAMRTATLAVELQNSVILGDEGIPASVPSLKATLAEAEAGTSNEKWMTPLRVWDAIRKSASAAVTWATLAGKPSTFPPDTHTHTTIQITDLRGGGNIASNTALGPSALANNTTGDKNTALGPSALQANTTGSGNTAIGPSALALSNGSFNTAIGQDALSFHLTGTNNTAIGIATLLQFENGSFLTAIGSGALAYFKNGNANTAIGNAAMLGLGANTKTHSNNTAVGDASQLKIDTGNGNSSFGAFSLINNTTGSQNTAVGNGALVDNVSYNNTSGLGYNAAVTGNNQVQLGNSSANTFAYGAVQDRSDLRDKADVRDTTLGLDFILSLRPVDFRWDMREDYRPEPTYDHSGAPIPSKPLAEITHDGTKKRSRYHHGLIAQEVRDLLEKKQIDFGGYQDHSVKGGDDVLSLGYIELIAPLIKAVQELSARVEKLESLPPAP